jgi:hypothetical protein
MAKKSTSPSLASLDQLALSLNPVPDKASTGHAYTHIYDQLFSQYRDDRITILEIGVWEGASIDLWLKYFLGARIIGVDIDLSRAKDKFTDNARVTLYQGNQEDSEFLKSLPGADIVIDDGAHLVYPTVSAFHWLWPKTRLMYIVEDLHTYYWPESNPSNSDQWLIELARDCLGRGKTHADNAATEIKSIQFYQSLAVIKKI